ncbi:MAG TPA: hypothetical protein VGS22_16400 [Thermoanaerobaculia bacterium]|jgi:hypothetical protein|nr:hypothetical protein [Thermoanaerobaculia bacterium]
MRVKTPTGVWIDWFPSLAAAVEVHAPVSIQWEIPCVRTQPEPIATQVEAIKRQPCAVAVEKGTVYRRLSPTVPRGSVLCYFIGAVEIDLGDTQEIGTALAAEVCP